MAKLELEVKVTELDIMKELIYLCVEFYCEMPQEMCDRFDEWKDKLKKDK